MALVETNELVGRTDFKQNIEHWFIVFLGTQQSFNSISLAIVDGTQIKPWLEAAVNVVSTELLHTPLHWNRRKGAQVGAYGFNLK